MIVDVLTFNQTIKIGKQGENLAKTITFDCKDWLGDLTGGTLSLVAQRPTDEDGYPVPATTTEDTITWTVTSTDLAFDGIGYCEVRYMLGEMVAKTQTFLTEIKKGLTPNETPPEVYEPYIDAVTDAAEGVLNMTATASVENDGGEPSVDVDKTETDHVNLHFNFRNVIGRKGDDGKDGKDGKDGNDGKGIGHVGATVDSGTGTPSVDVYEYEEEWNPNEKNYILNFHNLKGATGATGATGADGKDGADGLPGADGKDGKDGADGDSIGTVTATVDAGTGTPSVDVTQTGGSGSPINVALAFHNLKGSLSPVLLYEKNNYDLQNMEMQLSDDVFNYSLIVIRWDTNQNHAVQNVLCPALMLTGNLKDNDVQTNNSGQWNFIRIKQGDSTVLQTGGTGGTRNVKVYGIK